MKTDYDDEDYDDDVWGPILKPFRRLFHWWDEYKESKEPGAIQPGETIKLSARLQKECYVIHRLIIASHVTQHWMIIQINLNKHNDLLLDEAPAQLFSENSIGPVFSNEIVLDCEVTLKCVAKKAKRVPPACLLLKDLRKPMFRTFISLTRRYLV